MARYEIHKHEHTNEWSVIDTETGEIARERNVLLAGLSQSQALAVAERLNRLAQQEPRSDG